MKCACAIGQEKLQNLEEVNKILLCPLHAAAPALLEACKKQRRAIDILFAQLILKDETFMPSESGQPWEALKSGNEAIEKAFPPSPRAPDWFA